MRKKVVNTIYICALFLDLLFVSIPVLPSLTHFCAICLFFLYIVLAGIKINNAYKNWSLVYISFFLLSSLWALKMNVALFVVIVQILPILLMAFATITYVKNNQNINDILFVIYIVALFMLLYLALHIEEFIIGVRLGDSLNEEGAEGPKWNSNGVGISLCFAIFSGFILFVNQRRHLLLRVLYYATASLMIVAILLTGSRKSLLILLMPIFYFLYKKQKRHFLLLLLLTPLIAWFVYELIMNVEVFYETIGKRIEEMIAIMSNDTTGNEDTSRTILIEFGLNKFVENPILGVGINNFRVLSDVIFPGKNFYAHNNYIEMLVDVGIVGFIIYYSSYIYIYTRLRKSSSILSDWAKIFLFVMLFLGFFEVLYYEPLEQLMFCLIFCILDLEKRLYGKKIKNC